MDTSSKILLLLDKKFITVPEGQPNILKKICPISFGLFFKTFKMSKKWPFQVPEEYLNVKISKLRKIHGIDILTSEELNYSPTHWSGSINN